MRFKTDNKAEKGFTLPNFSKKNLGGFTLIELLVVIAIIGILAGIVLVVLGGARDRAKDARIQADMTQFRTQGELIFSSDGNYGNVDCAVGNIKTLCDDITSQGPATVTIKKPVSPVDEYCAEVELNSGQFWCVDSELNSVQGACPDTAPFICVAGGGNGGGAVLRVFVTSLSYGGNLREGGGGLAGADIKCQDRANATGIGDVIGVTWMAWLSGGPGSQTPSTRFSISETTDPIYLVDGTTIVANNWADLIDGNGIQNPINQLESGGIIGGGSVWTGTEEDGTANINDCADWTGSSSLADGHSGSSFYSDEFWTSITTLKCFSFSSLYCFSQSPF